MQRILPLRTFDYPKLYTGFKTQLTRIRFTVFISAALALVGVMGVYAIGVVTKVPLADLTRDPAAINHTQFYYGLLTYVDIVLWASATAICLLGAIMAGRKPEYLHVRRFLISAGLFSMILLADDALLLHEEVFPHILGIHEKLVLAAYLLGASAFLYFFFNEIENSDYMILILGLAFLATSVLMDKFVPQSDIETFVEDGFKLFGIVFWAVYFARYVVNMVQTRFVK